MLSPIIFGSYLECSAPQVAALHHSSWSLLPVQVVCQLLTIHKFSLHLFFSSPCTISIPSYEFVFFCFPFRFLYCFPFHLCYLILAPHHHHHHPILCFSLCPLEVNLHTYLTTWLSSCPVGIFFGFLTIIDNSKKS